MVSLAAHHPQPTPPAQRTPGPNRVFQADPAQDARQQAVLQITVWERILRPLETRLPPFSPGRAAGQLAEGRFTPVVLVTAAFTPWAGLGWWIACRVTWQGYHSEKGRRRGIRAGLQRGEAAQGPARARLGWDLPGLLPGTAAVARAMFHATRRDPEFLMSLALAVAIPWFFLQ